jgi:hypothetical protein
LTETNETISQAEAARRLSVSREMVRLYVRRGMPTSGKRVLWPAAENWRKLNVVRDKSRNSKTRSGEQGKPKATPKPAAPKVGAETMAAAAARKESAIADIREMERGQKRGELVNVAEIELELARVVIAVRNQFLMLPGKAAARVTTMTAPDAQNYLRVEIKRILTALSQGLKMRGKGKDAS